MISAELSLDRTTLTVHVPVTFSSRRGKKRMIAPNGATHGLCALEVMSGDYSPLMKALARAFRWKRMLDSGEYSSLSDLAAAENFDRPKLGKILHLTLLAPDLVEAILDSQALDNVPVDQVIVNITENWDVQRSRWPEA